MSDEEDDYLSDKFLASLVAPKPSTSSAANYAERRRIAQRESERKRLEGRIKSRRELEEDARREGLSQNLFDKEMEKAGAAQPGIGGAGQDGEVQLEKVGGSGASKAMSMMLRMGFKPGETLGKKEEPAKPGGVSVPSDEKHEGVPEPEKRTKSGHLTEPLPLAMWAGMWSIFMCNGRGLITENYYARQERSWFGQTSDVAPHGGIFKSDKDFCRGGRS